MCGIFGIYTNQVKKINKKYILQDLNLFSKLSLSRGQDTFGVVFSKDQKEYVYKVNTHPIKALKRKDFENFIDPVFKNFDDTKYFSAIGQTRLVTNGSKFLSENNQPIVTTNIIGVHNGIIIEKDKNTLLRQNQEGYNIKSDSLVFFENLNRFFLESKDNFFEKYINYLNNTDGNYSIAFRIPYLKLNFLSSNCGSLYYFSSDEYFIFASEKNILEDFIAKSKFKINFQKQKIKKILNEQVIFDDNLKIININEILEKKINIQNKNFKIYDNISQEIYRRDNLVKCSKCILPSTYPFIKFDEKGVSNYFKKYKKQEFLGEQKLFEVLEKYRSKNGEPDCVVGLSGGRDSSYGLHLLKTKFKMNPIAFTYDWGLTTDVSRVNQSKICGKLGVEHIIRSANIPQKRNYVRNNIMAWLKRPHLGMLPVVQAGDKPFMDYGDIIAKQYGIKLVVQFTGYQLEQREFFLGFAGINQPLSNNQRMSSYSLTNKLKMFYFYSTQSLINPSYLNAALFDNFKGFISSFVRKEDSLHFYNYIRWDEKEMIDVLVREYDWMSDLAYGKNQWRMGDGQTIFNNFIYYTLAGFSEFDNFRSNQICEGILDRESALKLARIDNSFKYDILKNFSEIIGFNLDDVLSRISSLQKLY
jgi:glucosamine--fructose-6-phosphate aminotransferase (isomerizing)